LALLELTTFLKMNSSSDSTPNSSHVSPIILAFRWFSFAAMKASLFFPIERCPTFFPWNFLPHGSLHLSYLISTKKLFFSF